MKHLHVPTDPSLSDLIIPERPAMYSELQDDPDMYELVEYFVRCLPERCAQVEAAYRAQDFTSLTMIAHGLKGAGGGFGFPLVTTSGAILEQRARAPDDLPALKQALEDFLAICRSARLAPAPAVATASRSA